MRPEKLMNLSSALGNFVRRYKLLPSGSLEEISWLTRSEREADRPGNSELYVEGRKDHGGRKKHDPTSVQ